MSRHRRTLRLAIGFTLLVLATSVAPASARSRPVAATQPSVVVPSSDCVGIEPCLPGAPDARIRRIGRTNLVGNDVHNTDAIGQTLAANLGPGEKARFSITVENESTSPDSFHLGVNCSVGSLAAAASQIEIVLYHGWPAGEPIFPTPTIAPGGTYRMRAIVSVSSSPVSALAPAAVAQLKCVLTFWSVNDPAASDAVAFIIDLELPST